jgi:signal transduction histidine kinase
VQRLIDVIPQPVYVKDAKSCYLMVNTAFAKDRGMPREHLIGRPSAVNPVTSGIVFAEDAEVLAGHSVLKEEFRPHPVTGHPRYRVIAKGSCLDDEGQPVIVGANFDVTPWRLAEMRLSAAKDEAERANAAKSLFLTNMSHELRTPMHGILSFARLGVERSDSATPERLQGYFSRIVASGERLMGLLDDLLDLAKLESGRMEMSLARRDVFPLVQQVVDEFEALAANTGIAVKVAGPSPAMAIVDAKLFAQVVRNLLSNALKFSQQAGEVRIELDVARMESGRDGMPGHGMALELRVSDRGPGIPDDELESVFNKFVQSSHTRSGAGGTGLGLAICREIVSAHHGLIYARNRMGGGAEFVVRLPAGLAD